MEIGLTSFYLEPGTAFRISGDIDPYISKKLNEEFADKIQLGGSSDGHDLWLTINATQYSEVALLKGPYIAKKDTYIEWSLVLPYQTITSAENLVTAYIDTLFNTLVDLLPRYGVEVAPLRILQAEVKQEVVGKPVYELTEDELFIFSQDEIIFDFEDIEEEADSTYYPTLFRKTDDEILYWEIWFDKEDEEILLHRGTVGATGELHFIPLAEVEDLEQELAGRFKEKTEEGYREIDSLDRTEFAVQYRSEEEFPKALDNRHELEALLDTALSQTGNGYCREGDIGGGTINAYCQVLYVEEALASILEVLEREELLKGVTIGYLDEVEEEYYVLYPAMEKDQVLDIV